MGTGRGYAVRQSIVLRFDTALSVSFVEGALAEHPGQPLFQQHSAEGGGPHDIGKGGP
jgi:hypothetical protein